MFLAEFLSIFTIVVAGTFFLMIVHEMNKVIDEIKDEPPLWKRPRA